MVVWWGCDIEEMNGIYTRTSMSSVLGLGVGVGVGTGVGLNFGVGFGVRFSFGFSVGLGVCVSVCVCVLRVGSLYTSISMSSSLTGFVDHSGCLGSAAVALTIKIGRTWGGVKTSF